MAGFEDELRKQRRRLPKIQRDTQREILRLLERARTDVQAQLAGVTTAAAAAQLARQQAAINAAIERFRARVEGRLQSGLGDGWRAGIELITQPAAAAGMTLATGLQINDQQLLAMREFLTGRIKDLSVEAVDEINQVLAEVLIGTRSQASAITEIERILGGVTRRRAMTIAYTEIGRAYAAASYEAMKAAEAAGAKLAKMWKRSGKLHPRAPHVHADGQIARVSQPFLIFDRKTGEAEKLRYPRDPKASPGNTINCGCDMVPVLDGSVVDGKVVKIPDDKTSDVVMVSKEDHKADRAERAKKRTERLKKLGIDATPAEAGGIKVVRASDLEAAAKATPPPAPPAPVPPVSPPATLPALDVPGVQITRASDLEAAGVVVDVVAPFEISRAPWDEAAMVAIHQLQESIVKRHPRYAAAKAGNMAAAADLVEDTLSFDTLEAVRSMAPPGVVPVLLPVVALESAGNNPIPLALAHRMSASLGWPVYSGLIQANRVARTGSDGYYRLAIQPVFAGNVGRGVRYILVDDFVGQGATLANLRGFIVSAGGVVLGYSSLTGKPISATLSLRAATLAELRQIHGKELEGWWRAVFGYGFEALTESEARYLIARPDAGRIRTEIIGRIRANR